MDLNSKIDINEILEKEICIFNSSWDSLDNTKKTLEQYSSFIQKFLDIINTYYMSLTELRASFPSSLFSYSENDLDKSMKNTSELFLSFIENQLNNLLNFLGVTQSILFALNKYVSNSDSILQKTKEKNKSIFSNIKILNDKYYNEYLLMINSFDNLEDKIVKRYVKNKYNISEEDRYSGDDDNIIKNCVAISKKLENSFLNFKKEEIKQYIYEYNNNLEEIINNKLFYNKDFQDCIINIINCFKEYFNNSINSIHKELSEFESDYSTTEINENNIYNKVKEKEINSLIYNIFNSKKYNIKVLKNNEIMNDDDWDIVDLNEENQVVRRKSKIFLSNEDIYNIMKEIYNYDFISINKEDYNLDNEKQKLKVLDLTKKLLSYDLNKHIKEKISDEEVKTLNNLLKNNNNQYEIISFFLSELFQIRGHGKFEMNNRVFDIINNILQYILDEVINEKNDTMNIISSIVMISVTFYVINHKEKIYLSEEIKNYKIFRSIEFWSDFIVMQIEEDLKNNNNNINKDDEERKKKKNNDILLSKILPTAITMKKYDIDKDSIFKIIDNLMNRYQLDKKSKESLLAIIRKQI